MSQNKYASPLRIEIHSSLILVIFVSAIHAGAIAMLAVSETSWLIKLALTLVVLGSLLFFLGAHRRAARFGFLKKLFPQIRNIVWGNDDRWILITEDGEELRAQLLTSSFVHPQLTTVNLKLAAMPWYNRYRSFVFMRDNLDAETFRRLRVRLRWYSTSDQDSLGVLK